MERPDYVKELIAKLTTVEFLKVMLSHLDGTTIKTEEELLLLDKVMYKTANISKDFKMLLLTPEVKEKFLQRMKQLKLDENDFMNMVKPFEKGKGPYTKPPAVPEPKPTKDVPQRPYKPEIIPEKPTVALSSDNKRPLSFGSSGRPAEKREAPKRRARSSSSSSSSSSSEERENYQDKIKKLQNEIARLNAAKSSEQRPQPPNKYSFSLKKPELPRTRQMFRPSPPEEDSYFEKSNRAREPRSERGDRDHREPEPFSPHRGKESYSPQTSYRGGKMYRPPFNYKRGK